MFCLSPLASCSQYYWNVWGFLRLRFEVSLYKWLFLGDNWGSLFPKAFIKLLKDMEGLSCRSVLDPLNIALISSLCNHKFNYFTQTLFLLSSLLICPVDITGDLAVGCCEQTVPHLYSGALTITKNGNSPLTWSDFPSLIWRQGRNSVIVPSLLTLPCDATTRTCLFSPSATWQSFENKSNRRPFEYKDYHFAKQQSLQALPFSCWQQSSKISSCAGFTAAGKG